MKVEIKKISIPSIFFSVFPLVVFVVMFVGALMEVFNPDVAFSLGYVMSLVLRAVVNTILTLVSVFFFVLSYNVLCSLGIRGVNVELEDK